ncbi:expressed unknown protein [Seminavis robusta]|uniref:Tail assembly chaperone n=1 Tax=Seminavis robusta TaxID=568900 RepID=A0A9N8HGE0_9STRA|nr:expressed unknown protein [Seminavis robusta]|eukprot:Sro393_g133520.1 n/a (197) ;mRNA; f:10148-10738
MAGKKKEKTRPQPMVAVDVEEDPLTVEQEALIAQIQEAFKGVQLEDDGTSLQQTELLDAGRDPSDLEGLPTDERDDWTAILDRTLEDFGVVFSFTDKKGYKFYLPAYMIWTIRHHPSTEYLEKRATQALNVDAAIYALNPDTYQFESVSFVKWFSTLQIQAIIKFLEYSTRHESLDIGTAELNLEKIQKAVQKEND